MKITIFFLILGICLNPNSTQAASYDTLPKGVNAFVLKQVVTSKIESRFDSNNQDGSLAFKENFTSNKLQNINSAIKTYFQELNAISPDAYNQFSLGEFQADAYAEASAQGVGFARGITDHFTVYASLPIYHIKTSVKFNQTHKSNLASIQSTIQNSSFSSSAISNFVKQLTMQLPETNEQLLQSLIVNYYGYKPLGTWEKDALGDAEIGGLFRLTDFNDKGFSIAGGIVLPTGDADDPDSLQDAPTGDGQLDTFIESNAGISFFENSFQIDFKNRFTYQFASKKQIRTTDNSHVPLSQSKELMSEKLGNKTDSTLTFTFNPNHWINLNTSFLYNETGASRYEASNLKVKSVLETNTLTINQWARVGIGFSSVEMYKAKKIEIPFEFNLSAQKILNAKNSVNYERFDCDFRLYF